MSHKEKIHQLFDEMCMEMASFIKDSEGGHTEGWVPAALIKDQLELKKSSYPQGNITDNQTGWLFATMARYLQDKDILLFKKESSRSYYKTK